MKFQELKISQNILEALDKLHYAQMMPIQEAVIPELLNHVDVLAQAETGSGKTAAFAIPVIEHCVLEERGVQALILAPTRELSMQIKEDCDNIAAYKRLRTIAIYGKSSYQFQKEALKQRVHIVCGTPGRILDHLKNETLDLSNLKHLVIDEADEMLKLGLLESVKAILSYVPECTISLFSATMNESIQQLAKARMRNPKELKLSESSTVKKTIEHYGYHVKTEEKAQFLLKLLCHHQPQSAMIFGKTQESVQEIAQFLYDHHILCDMIHGGMVQEDRIENLEDFKRGKLRVLVATDVASRGIDVEDVTHIINYDAPTQSEAYIHRIGRSARKEKSGCAITLICKEDEWRIEKLNEYLQKPLEIRDSSSIAQVEISDAQLRRLSEPVKLKEKKGKDVHADTMKLYLNAGKSKKIRAGDIVGAICEIEGVTGEDIGVIALQDHQSYVDILHGKGRLVLKQLKKIKKKAVKVEIAK